MFGQQQATAISTTQQHSIMKISNSKDKVGSKIDTKSQSCLAGLVGDDQIKNQEYYFHHNHHHHQKHHGCEQQQQQVLLQQQWHHSE